jgi:hypothetical protein
VTIRTNAQKSIRIAVNTLHRHPGLQIDQSFGETHDDRLRLTNELLAEASTQTYSATVCICTVSTTQSLVARRPLLF